MKNDGIITMSLQVDLITWQISDLLALAADAIEAVPEWHPERTEFVGKHKALREGILALLKTKVGK